MQPNLKGIYFNHIVVSFENVIDFCQIFLKLLTFYKKRSKKVSTAMFSHCYRQKWCSTCPTWCTLVLNHHVDTRTEVFDNLVGLGLLYECQRTWSLTLKWSRSRIGGWRTHFAPFNPIWAKLTKFMSGGGKRSKNHYSCLIPTWEALKPTISTTWPKITATITSAAPWKMSPLLGFFSTGFCKILIISKWFVQSQWNFQNVSKYGWSIPLSSLV